MDDLLPPSLGMRLSFREAFVELYFPSLRVRIELLVEASLLLVAHGKYIGGMRFLVMIWLTF